MPSPSGIGQIVALRSGSQTADGSYLAADDLRITRIAIVALALLFSYGLPLSLIGVASWQSQRILQIFILCTLPFHFVKHIKRRAYPRHFGFMLGFFGYMTFVSAIYNFAIVPNSLETWAPGIGFVMPLLLFSLYDLFEVKIREVSAGFIAVAVVCALVAAVDQIVNLPSLDQYVRTATFDKSLRRVVLAKTEQAFSVAIIFAAFLRVSSSTFKAFQLFFGLIIIYALFVISESRLAIAATLLGCFIYAGFFHKTRYRILIVSSLLLTMAVLQLFVFEKYFAILDQIGDLGSDSSVAFRALEGRFFEAYFKPTYGLGFGYMHIVEWQNNVLSHGMFRAGAELGAIGYPVSLGDLGLHGALYQYGYIGFTATLALTMIMLRDLVTAGRDNFNQNRHLYGAFASISIAFILSPLPMNFFTLDWTVTFGGTLWYVAAISKGNCRKFLALR